MSLYYQTSIVPCISRMIGTLLCPELGPLADPKLPLLGTLHGEQPADNSSSCSRCVSPCVNVSLGTKLGTLSKKPHSWGFFIDKQKCFIFGVRKWWNLDLLSDANRFQCIWWFMGFFDTLYMDIHIALFPQNHENYYLCNP